ncbi:hypothetical protein [Exiguobacterium sp. ERU656]|uniref:hypothetical protein n=1 Tax=Exiguobacterium sp. ERU656 TaxID=2751217 RepID=UPI0020371430|nr:hypothetical protein [Exiguobacterium sp. ERU656]
MNTSFLVSLVCVSFFSLLLPSSGQAALPVTRHTVMWSIPEASISNRRPYRSGRRINLPLSLLINES